VIPLVVCVIIFVVLAIAGPSLGADTRDGKDWKKAERLDLGHLPDSSRRP
jgi:hypothetical protein